ncbi:Alpha-1,4 glucan phosphorylase L isozyme, chloroplastic/amyloplastic [Capsicum chinense]|nr:Alpha-1,4 glucan phosphorylase L isozyme, chloroplastic/amyloplastic [Capsicum chinense]
MRDRPIGDLINGLKQLSAEVDCFLGKKCPAVQIVSEGGLPGLRIKYQVEFTPSFSSEKFELPKAYYATAKSVRDMLIINWNATYDFYENMNLNQSYYLSMEFLQGKTLLHTIGNLGVIGPYADALTKLEYSLEDVAMQIPISIVFRGPNGAAAGVGAQHSQGVFINPTLAEPFGLTLIETGAHGLPMVSTKNGGPVDIHGVKRPAFHGLVTLSPPPVHH